MAVLRLDRFTIDHDNTAELLARHAALVAVGRDAFPGLIDAQLAKVDDQAWLTVWRWESLANAKAAIAKAPSVPEAKAALSLAKDLTVEFAEVIDNP